MRAIFSFGLLYFIFSFAVASAQFDQSFFSPSSPLQFEPALPEPNQPFVASLSQGNSRLNGSEISWLINGELLPAGNNLRRIELTAPPAGETMSIEVVLMTLDGEAVVERATVSPLYLDIIIEPQTRIPVFYRGRALPSPDSLARIIAVVNGDRLRPEDLTYRWDVAGEIIQQGLIRGAREVFVNIPKGARHKLNLQVFNLDGAKIAERSIQLYVQEPELLFYEKSSLYGQSNIALDRQTNLIGNSLTVMAEPYHLDLQIYNNPTLAEWQIGRESQAVSGNPYEITLERRFGSGSSQVTFHVRDLERLLQGDEAGFNLIY